MWPNTKILNIIEPSKPSLAWSFYLSFSTNDITEAFYRPRPCYIPLIWLKQIAQNVANHQTQINHVIYYTLRTLHAKLRLCSDLGTVIPICPLFLHENFCAKSGYQWQGQVITQYFSVIRVLIYYHVPHWLISSRHIHFLFHYKIIVHPFPDN